MSIGAYLYFQGKCREAIDFYADAFQAEQPKVMTYGETPGGGGKNMPEEVKKLVMHAAMKIAGDDLLMSDAMPDEPVTIGDNVSVIVYLKTVDQVVAVFNKLKVGGEVIMEAQETFFSKCYAYVIDKFGVSWQLNYNTLTD